MVKSAGAKSSTTITPQWMLHLDLLDSVGSVDSALAHVRGRGAGSFDRGGVRACVDSALAHVYVYAWCACVDSVLAHVYVGGVRGVRERRERAHVFVCVGKNWGGGGICVMCDVCKLPSL